MEIDTSCGLPALQTAGADGGMFLGALALLPIAFLGLVLGVALGSVAVESKIGNFDSAWATAVATVAALVVSASVRTVISVPPLEAELVAVSSALSFPLGIAVRRRNRLSAGVIGGVLAVALYSMTRVFPNTFGEVVPLTLGAGVVFFLVGCAFDGE